MRGPCRRTSAGQRVGRRQQRHERAGLTSRVTAITATKGVRTLRRMWPGCGQGGQGKRVGGQAQMGVMPRGVTAATPTQDEAAGAAPDVLCACNSPGPPCTSCCPTSATPSAAGASAAGQSSRRRRPACKGAAAAAGDGWAAAARDGWAAAAGGGAGERQRGSNLRPPPPAACKLRQRHAPAAIDEEGVSTGKEGAGKPPVLGPRGLVTQSPAHVHVVKHFVLAAAV